MPYDWLPPQRRRRWILLCRRLDRLAEWANPVLMVIAAVLLILDLSCLAAWGLPTPSAWPNFSFTPPLPALCLPVAGEL